MGYLFEDKLRARAKTFIAALQGEGIKGTIVDGSFRDYTVKVAVSFESRDGGNINLYYSPKANSFSMKTHELKNKSLIPKLEACWHDAPQVTKTKAAATTPARGWQMYGDGSYIKGATGYGMVILKDGEVVAELSGPVAAEEVGGTRQVAGELRAVEAGLAWCLQNNVTEVEIFYDYYGVEKWATGAWKANQPLTQAYGKSVRQTGVRIRWRKVAAHTGNRWNDRADVLAKQGALGQLGGRNEMGSANDSANAPGPVTTDELVSELLECKDRFLDFLLVNGVEAVFDDLYNDQFTRILIINEDEKTLGYFDLYHTRRKPFSPYLHNFKDAELKARLESLWREFAITPR